MKKLSFTVSEFELPVQEPYSRLKKHFLITAGDDMIILILTSLHQNIIHEIKIVSINKRDT